MAEEDTVAAALAAAAKGVEVKEGVKVDSRNTRPQTVVLVASQMVGRERRLEAGAAGAAAMEVDTLEEEVQEGVELAEAVMVAAA